MADDIKHVTPAVAGALVPDPDTGDWLPAAGDDVRWSTYWARRELCGEIVVSDVSPPSAASAPSETPAPEAKPSAKEPRRAADKPSET